jgi:hypothetical protein
MNTLKRLWQKWIGLKKYFNEIDNWTDRRDL